jgi:hypothetical protein
MSWWESQQFAWRIAAGCFGISGIGSGMLGEDKMKQAHVGYPKGTQIKARTVAIKKYDHFHFYSDSFGYYYFLDQFLFSIFLFL